MCSAHCSGAAARMEKYIANNAAKNISSLDSQTIVPTLTMFGRVKEWIRLGSMVASAAVTRPLLPLIFYGLWRGAIPPRVAGTARVPPQVRAPRRVSGDRAVT
ncbi:hypothetical protein GCM10023223_12200 [Stackebrandtia albiflava]